MKIVSTVFSGDRLEANKAYLREISEGSKVYTYWNEYVQKSKLPTYDWLVENVFFPMSQVHPRDQFGYHYDMIKAPCELLGIFVFYSQEFVDRIVETIRGIGPERVVEIGAGDGLLSKFLGDQGIDVVATDDYSKPLDRPSTVENIGHLDALNKYSPDLAVMCWEDLDSTASIDVLCYPTIKHLLWVGETYVMGGWFGCTGTEELLDFEHDYVENDYALGRTDMWVFDEFKKNTHTLLFRPVKREKSIED